MTKPDSDNRVGYILNAPGRPANQREALLAVGVPANRIFEDTPNGSPLLPERAKAEAASRAGTLHVATPMCLGLRPGDAYCFVGDCLACGTRVIPAFTIHGGAPLVMDGSREAPGYWAALAENLFKKERSRWYTREHRARKRAAELEG